MQLMLAANENFLDPSQSDFLENFIKSYHDADDSLIDYNTLFADMRKQRQADMRGRLHVISGLGGTFNP